MWKRIRLTLEMIKFEHSVFALPFALTGALLAIRHSGLSAGAACGKIGWIVVAMVGARSAAMAFNRLIDAGIDARNPAHAHAPPAGRRALAWLYVGLRGDLRAGLRIRGGRAESALLPAGARGARNCILLLIYQTLHVIFAPGAGICAGCGAGGGLDRHTRLARSPHPLADRGGHLLDRRLRHHLRLPGLRIRFGGGSVQPAAPAGHRGRVARGASPARADDRVPAGPGLRASAWAR